MKLRTLSAFALVFAAACANEAAKGDRNTGTALEGGATVGAVAAPAPAVSIDTAAATSPAPTATSPATTGAPEAVSGHDAGASQAQHDSAAPAAHP